MDALTSFVPLMQTIVWPLAILTLMVLFRRHVRRAFDVLIERLESGSPFEAGPVKLGAGLSPSTQEERNRKLEREMAPFAHRTGVAATERRRPDSVRATVVSPSLHFSRLEMARFRRIEDAALTRLSAQIGTPITREVKPSRHSPLVFDGVALSPESYRIVEVRIVRSVHHATDAVRHSLDSVTAFLISLDAKTRRFVSVTVVLVVSRDFTGESALLLGATAAIVGDYPVPVQIECYAESELFDEAGHDDGTLSSQ